MVLTPFVIVNLRLFAPRTGLLCLSWVQSIPTLLAVNPNLFLHADVCPSFVAALPLGPRVVIGLFLVISGAYIPVVL